MHRVVSASILVILMLHSPREAAAQGRPNQPLGGWGDLTDPKGDCRASLDGGRLTIGVPGTHHNLCAEVGEMEAPRVLRKIDGDFMVQAKVSGNVAHSGKSTSVMGLAYHGAGLVLWLDEKTYLRLERAAVVRPEGEVIHYANFELRRDSEVVSSVGIRIPDQDTYLRLERRGERIYAMVGTDGNHWTSFEPIAVTLPKDLKLGFAAINTSTDPLKAVFSDLEVFRSEAKRSP
jgi:regulation of enolase protein 1 (concanavalin A-like superfamily)